MRAAALPGNHCCGWRERSNTRSLKMTCRPVRRRRPLSCPPALRCADPVPPLFQARLDVVRRNWGSTPFWTPSAPRPRRLRSWTRSGRSWLEKRRLAGCSSRSSSSLSTTGRRCGAPAPTCCRSACSGSTYTKDLSVSPRASVRAGPWRQGGGAARGREQASAPPLAGTVTACADPVSAAAAPPGLGHPGLGRQIRCSRRWEIFTPTRWTTPTRRPRPWRWWARPATTTLKLQPSCADSGCTTSAAAARSGHSGGRGSGRGRGRRGAALDFLFRAS